MDVTMKKRIIRAEEKQQTYILMQEFINKKFMHLLLKN